MKVAIFVEWLGQGFTLRNQSEIWQLSLDSISASRNSCLNIWIHRGYHRMVNFKLPDVLVDALLVNDSKFTFFSGMNFLMDGTHFDMVVDADKMPAFRNRKGSITTNVLLVCNHDMLINYAYVGVEGSAHDTFVLKECIRKDHFKVPDGLYIGIIPKFFTSFNSPIGTTNTANTIQAFDYCIVCL